MTATWQSPKLIELRAKTDRDLVTIIDSTLENALLLADVGSDVDAAGALHRRAADIRAYTAMLLEKVEDLRERRRLEEKLKQLRDALDLQVRMQAAGS